MASYYILAQIGHFSGSHDRKTANAAEVESGCSVALVVKEDFVVQTVLLLQNGLGCALTRRQQVLIRLR